MVIVFDVALKDCLKVPLAEDDRLIRTFPADGPDEPLGEWIFPRDVPGGQLFLKAEIQHAPGELRV
jgi:hypothetical protein